MFAVWSLFAALTMVMALGNVADVEVEFDVDGVAVVTIENGATVDIKYREAVVAAPFPAGAGSEAAVEFTHSPLSHCCTEDSMVQLKTPGIIIHRGLCSFADKIRGAIRAGATHVLIVDNPIPVTTADATTSSSTDATQPQPQMLAIMGDAWETQQPWVAAIHASSFDRMVHGKGQEQDQQNNGAIYSISFQSKYAEEERAMPALQCFRRIDTIRAMGHHNHAMRSFATTCMFELLRNPNGTDVGITGGSKLVQRAMKLHEILSDVGAITANLLLLEWCSQQVLHAYAGLRVAFNGQHKLPARDSKSIMKQLVHETHIANTLAAQLVDSLIKVGAWATARELVAQFLHLQRALEVRLGSAYWENKFASSSRQSEEDGKYAWNFQYMCVTELLLRFTTLTKVISSSSTSGSAAPSSDDDYDGDNDSGADISDELLLCDFDAAFTLATIKQFEDHPVLFLPARAIASALHDHGSHWVLTYLHMLTNEPLDRSTGIGGLYTEFIRMATANQHTAVSAASVKPKIHTSRAVLALKEFESHLKTAHYRNRVKQSHSNPMLYVLPTDAKTLSEELTAFIAHNAAMHRILTVFLDEFGAINSSRRQQLMYIATTNWLLPRQDIILLKIFVKKARRVGTSKQRQNQKKPATNAVELEEKAVLAMRNRAPYRNVESFIAGCHFSRIVTATPPVLTNLADYSAIIHAQEATLREIAATVKSARAAMMAQLSSPELRTVQKALVTSLRNETSITSTPATMMVGYSEDYLSTGGHTANARGLGVLQAAHRLLQEQCLAPLVPQSKQQQQEDSVSPKGTPSKTFASSARWTRRTEGTTLRVGFVSSFFYHHSVGRLIQRVITGLSNRDSMHTVVISLNDGWGNKEVVYNRKGKLEYADTTTEALAAAANTWLSLPFPANGLNDERRLHCRNNGTSCDPSYAPLLRTSLYKHAGKFFDLSFFQEMHSFIRELDLDVLVFPELGMDQLTLQLASERLAPIQAVFWGHPISQALPHIDYFISSDLYEEKSFHATAPATVPVPARSRSEQTVLFAGLTVSFRKPKIAATKPIDAAQQGFDYLGKLGLGNTEGPNSLNLYLLPHTLMKFSPQFDEALLGVLTADPRAVLLILTGDKQPLWAQKLHRRLLNSLSETSFASFPEDATASVRPNLTYIGSRIVLAQRLEQDEYYKVLRRASVVLDSYPFGMGVTALESFALGVPVVTLPSRQNVPSLVAGFIRYMDSCGAALASRLIASSTDEFVSLAVATASGEGRGEVSRQLKQYSVALYSKTNTKATLDEWEAFLHKV